MWELEYPLIFGLPKNKLEMFDGRTPVKFPFRTRAEGEAHFAAWLEQLCRWKGVADAPEVFDEDGALVAEAAGFRFELHRRPIRIEVPFPGEAFHTFYELAWRRDVWPGQPAGLERGWEWSQNHWDVQLNLWRAFGALCARHGGCHAGRTDLHLTPRSAVQPDQFYFRRPRADCLTPDGDYFQGVPDLIAEVLSASARWMDRGPRMELYARAGVPHHWLLEPELETVELYDLTRGKYRLTAMHGAGETFAHRLFPGHSFTVEALFETQERRHLRREGRDRPRREGAPPVPAWVLPREQAPGLEHLFLLGHPERRFEIWDDRAPCVLPFGSPEEARFRLDRFIEEACAWEGVDAPPARAAHGPDGERASVGRFHFSRVGALVRLDVDVEAAQYRRMAEVWSDRDAWDWGENPNQVPFR